MEYMKLNPEAVNCFRLSRGIKLAIAFIVCLPMILIGLSWCEGVLKYVLVILGILIFIYSLLMFIIYPKFEYRQWKYGIGDDRVEIEHGIFFITRTIIPIIRIQNISVSQGPVKRQFDLYDVDIATASGNETIPCLSKEVAEEISTNLKDRIYIRIEENEGRGRP